MPKIIALLFCLAVWVACQSGGENAGDTSALLPTPLLHARNFSMARTPDSLLLLSIGSAWKNAPHTFQYVLYPRHRPAPTRFPNATPVPVPLDRVICTGTTQAAMFDFIGVTDRIVAVADDKYIFNPSLRQRIADGQIPSIGNDGQWNFERALAANPQAVFAFSIGDNSQTIRKWQSLGIPVILLSEFMEPTPLGRAEWSRFLAAFFGNQIQTQTLTRFNDVARQYDSLAQQARQYPHRPTVLTGTAFEGSWFIAGGKSFMAQLIADAGGDYLWRDNPETGGVPLDFEAVYARALRADVWLNVLQTQSRQQLLDQNPRYADFSAFQHQRIYAYSRRLSPNGGYDFFESAIVQPQLVLQDLLRLFHTPADTALLHYYQPLL